MKTNRCFLLCWPCIVLHIFYHFNCHLLCSHPFILFRCRQKSNSLARGGFPFDTWFFKSKSLAIFLPSNLFLSSTYHVCFYLKENITLDDKAWLDYYDFTQPISSLFVITQNDFKKTVLNFAILYQKWSSCLIILAIRFLVCLFVLQIWGCHTLCWAKSCWWKCAKTIALS